MSTLVQIVPKVPGGIDGVGDYALTIAEKLRDKFGAETVFVTFKPRPGNVRGFDVAPLESLAVASSANRHILLHYVNYGFQKRGVPFRLVAILRELRRGGVHLVTIFHELYASGPPWTSAFWLQPIQIHLAKSVAQLSDSCIVSSDNFRRELNGLAPDRQIELHPVPSGIGEPQLSPAQIADRDPRRWVIFGGTALAERSLRSFLEVLPRIPDSIAPRKLFVLGGDENAAINSLLVDLPLESDYRPRIAANEASEILKTCSFAFFNYFHRPDVETAVILKSSAFASACAHALISVFPHSGSVIAINGDRLPGPFFVENERCDVPDANQQGKIGSAIYDWYHRRVSSEHLVGAIASLFGLGAGR